MADPKTRSSFLILTAAVVLVGGISFFAGRMSNVPETPKAAVSSAPPVASSAASVATGGAASSTAAPLPPLNSFPEVSFSQQGEDLIIKNIFAMLGEAEASYVDIGAHDPIKGNNTYLFYALGSKGVLIEPNPAFAAKLKKVRPRDVVIDKGIGIAPGESTADYFDFGDDGQENTFSKDQVDKLAKLGVKPQRVIKMPLVNINDVIAKHFPKEPPTLLSVDTEGFDLAILKSLDLKKIRPPVICAETLDVGGNKTIDEIATYLKSQHYVQRGGTFVNSIFVAEEAIAKGRGGAHAHGSSTPDSDSGAPTTTTR